MRALVPLGRLLGRAQLGRCLRRGGYSCVHGFRGFGELTSGFAKRLAVQREGSEVAWEGPDADRAGIPWRQSGTRRVGGFATLHRSKRLLGFFPCPAQLTQLSFQLVDAAALLLDCLERHVGRL